MFHYNDKTRGVCLAYILWTLVILVIIMLSWTFAVDWRRSKSEENIGWKTVHLQESQVGSKVRLGHSVRRVCRGRLVWTRRTSVNHW